MNLIERAKQFKVGAETIMEWLGAGAITVHPTLAQGRADVCLKCPLNVHESSITEAMAAAIKKQVEIKNKLQLRVNGEKFLCTYVLSDVLMADSAIPWEVLLKGMAVRQAELGYPAHHKDMLKREHEILYGVPGGRVPVGIIKAPKKG